MNKILLFVIILFGLSGCYTTYKTDNIDYITLKPSQKNTEICENVPISFPNVTKMLDIECSNYESFSFGNGDIITVKYSAPQENDFNEQSFDLPKSEIVSKDPIITLYRRMDTGRIIWESLPVNEIMDWHYIIDTVSDAAFSEITEEHYTFEGADIIINLSEGDNKETYGVFSDGTLCFFGDGVVAAKNAVDYYKFSALAYKYASDPYDIGAYRDAHWLLWAEKTSNPGETVSAPPSLESYKLCISGNDFHIDLDLNQAKILFSKLFGEEELSQWGNTMEYSIIPYGEILSGEPIRFTEYLNNEGTTYHNGGDPQILCMSHYLYPDGTILQPASEEWNYFYLRGIGTISSSYKRASMTEDAFDWNVLLSCVDELLKQ